MARLQNILISQETSSTQAIETMCENSSFVELNPTISKLPCFAQTIPVSTADVEKEKETHLLFLKLAFLLHYS